MQYPDFFDAVPRIRLHDPLAELLGAAEGGVIEYGYIDVVRLAGHSCPTVAAAYCLTRRALLALYDDDIAERGGVRVEFAADLSEGVAGVIASVVSLITGAAGDGGFKGLGGQHARRGLLRFKAELPAQMRLTRLDGRGSVDASADVGKVAADPAIGQLLPSCLAGIAAAADRRRFAALWQDRVRRVLIEHGDDPAVFTVRRSG